MFMVHIETAKKSYDTDSIYLADKPSSSGKWFINDAEKHGIYASDSKEITEKVFSHARELIEKGKDILTSDLKKYELHLKKEMNMENNETHDWNSLQGKLQHHIEMSEKLARERSSLVSSLKEMRENDAPEDIVRLAEKVMSLADRAQARCEEKTSFVTGSMDQDFSENGSCLIYRLENKLLTRANSAFKAGIVNAYDRIFEPLRKLHEKAVQNQIREETKYMNKVKSQLEQYTAKLQHKMGKRLEKANEKRARLHQNPFSSDTLLYYPREQEKINRLTLLLNSCTTEIKTLQSEIDLSQSKHIDRRQYIKTHTAIAKNEKVMENHKKILYEKKQIASPESAIIHNPEKPEENPNEASNTSPEEKNVSLPVYSPDGSYLGEQIISSAEVNALSRESESASQQSDILPETSSDNVLPEEPVMDNNTSVFEPVHTRFEEAKKEAVKSREIVEARYLYRVLDTKLPNNAFIEFEANGDAFCAKCNEYGDMHMEKYNYDTSKYDPISKEEAVNLFSKNTKEFDTAIRNQLGDVLIVKAEEQTVPDFETN